MAPKYEETNSQIGAGSVFQGNFYVDGSFKILGKFEGEIHTKDHLYIEETGKVKTNIKAQRVTISGTLIGDINASEEVVLKSTCKMLGNIKAPVLSVEKGAIHKGTLNLMAGNKNKDISKIVNDSYVSTPGFENAVKDLDEKNKLLKTSKKIPEILSK